ncbi:MAG: NUDIX domain-containing protein [Peptoniphilaceae bacterium]|nr:NUDIX domain-containing protein [Peptoniphilaceae bacterium]MDY6085669.1 NUDIX domain-containing protein [Peptoniphilaceae bacterium]
MHQHEDVQLLNMIMIRRADGCVLVLDKVKKEGWEGLTFPGGKVEPGESLVASVRREAWEETGLSVGAVQLVGFVHWLHDEGLRELGLLYETEDFSGTVTASAEGSLAWVPFETFLAMEPKSGSMDEMLRVYCGEAREVLIPIHQGKQGPAQYDR